MLSEPPARFAIPGSLPGLVRIIYLSVLSLIRDEEIGKFLLQRSDPGQIANHDVGIAGILESKILGAGSCRLFSQPGQDHTRGQHRSIEHREPRLLLEWRMHLIVTTVNSFPNGTPPIPKLKGGL